ncbi:MAG: hypothetical protein ACKVVP_16450 [Chloroflexota bacterium]
MRSMSLFAPPGRPARWLLGALAMVLLGASACAYQTPSGATPATPAVAGTAVTPAAVATVIAPPVAGREAVPVTFTRAATLHSAPSGDARIGERERGYARASAVRCAELRVLIIDPTPDKPAWVDREALTVPAGFCGDPASGAVSLKTVTACVGDDVSYRHAQQARTALARLVRLSLGPEDVFVPLRMDGTDLAPPLRLPKLVEPPQSNGIPAGLAPSPTPAGLNNIFRPTPTAAAKSPTVVPVPPIETQLAEMQRLKDHAATHLATLALGSPARGSVEHCFQRVETAITSGQGSRFVILAARVSPAEVQRLRTFALEGSILLLFGLECEASSCALVRSPLDQWAQQRHVEVRPVDASADLASLVR